MLTSVEVAKYRNLLEIVRSDAREASRSTQEGRHYFYSPFRQEKSPSFIVNKFNGRWYWRDFGANESGDTIEYVMKRDKRSFKEAVEYLSGMSFSRKGRNFRNSQNSQKALKELEAKKQKQQAFEMWEREYSDGLSLAIKRAHKALQEAKSIDDISDDDARLIRDLSYHEWQYDILCSRDSQAKKDLYESL